MGQNFQHFQLNDVEQNSHCRPFSKWTLHKSRPIMSTFHAAEARFFSGSHGAAESVLWSRRRVDRFHKPSGSRYVLRKSKKAISPTILFRGWDWNHQSYSREGSGFLGKTNFSGRIPQIHPKPEIYGHFLVGRGYPLLSSNDLKLGLLQTCWWCFKNSKEKTCVFCIFASWSTRVFPEPTRINNFGHIFP